MIVDAGYQALPIALVVAVYVAAASFIGAYRGLPALALSARYGLYTLPLLLGVSTAALVYAFVTDDFSVRYVAENSNLAMPDRYTWVALYAGNSGSLLFIAVTFSAVAAVAAAGLSRKLSFTAPFATGLMAVVLAFFIGVMVLMANPLDRLPFTPEDGRGINPLLIHFGMFIHPPVQMFGLASVAVPFSIAMGALLAGRGGRDEWVDQGRLWGVLSWLVLTTGLLLGSWWAYTILGWGGYWAWDPVENSALMPWLAMTAFVHSIMVQKRRGMFRMWNIVLVAIAFTLAEMGMFINRGGPVPSVHSFAQSTMGWTFLAFMTITLLGSLAAFAWRIDTLRSRERLESTLSRESAFLTQNVLLLVVAFVTLWGTVYPVIAEAFLGETVTVGEPFFNRVNGPILLVIVLLMGVGPLLPWRRASARTALRLLRYPLGAAVVVAAALAVAGVRQPVALLALAVVALGVTGILHELLRGTLSRHRRGESYPVALVRLMSANRPRYGGYVVHLGIAMLAVGAIGSSFYPIQRDFSMKPGDERTLAGYTFRYDAIESTAHVDRDEVVARFTVRKGGDLLGSMSTHRSFYREHRMFANQAAIRSTPIEDFYIVPSEFADDGTAVFRVYVNPLVWWMWWSWPIMLAGTLLAISPRRRPAEAVRRAFARPPGAAAAEGARLASAGGAARR